MAQTKVKYPGLMSFESPEIEYLVVAGGAGGGLGWKNNIPVTPVPYTAYNSPASGNPIVESTESIEDPIETCSSTFVLPGTVNVPSIKSLSLYPTNNDNL